MLSEGGMHVPFVVSMAGPEFRRVKTYPHPVSALGRGSNGCGTRWDSRLKPSDFDGVNLSAISVRTGEKQTALHQGADVAVGFTVSYSGGRLETVAGR